MVLAEHTSVTAKPPVLERHRNHRVGNVRSCDVLLHTREP